MSQATKEYEDKIPTAPKSGAELTMNSLSTTGPQPIQSTGLHQNKFLKLLKFIVTNINQKYFYLMMMPFGMDQSLGFIIS